AVQVEDKLAPSLNCPPIQSVPCHQSTDWDYVGAPETYDNCGVATLEFDDQENTNSCGSGQIVRVWTATDNYGNSNSCTQTINIFDNTPVEVNFPPDYTTYNCTTIEDLAPENLPAPFDRPEVLYEDCELIATNYEDWVFTAASESCVKILREWRVIDWCSYEYGGSTGIWSETQILKIQDTLPPVFTCPDDLVVPTSFTSCVANFTLPQPTDIQDCLPGVEVSVFGDLGNGTQYSGVPIGTYEMKYVLKDGCNNTSSCEILVTVEDATAPTPVCLEGVSIALMQGGMNELWASDIEIGSSYDNCTSYDNLDLRLGFEPAPGQTTPPPSDALTFTCDNMGMNVIALWVGDKAGNWGYCLTSAVVQDNAGVCSPDTTTNDPMVAVAGHVYDHQGDKVPDTEVRLNGLDMEMTDTLGDYLFDEMPMGGSYEITASKDDDPRDGITTADLLMLARHLMGVDTITSPYQLAAADVDQSGTLDSDDIMMLHFILLGIQPDLADDLGWRFIPESFDFPDDSLMTMGYPESILIDTLGADFMDGHFTAIKLGDVNASAIEDTSSTFASLENRNLTVARLKVDDAPLEQNQIYEIPFYASKDGLAVDGGLIQLSHPGLEIVAIESGHAEGIFMNAASNVATTISWVANIVSDQPLFILKVRAMQTVVLSEAMGLHSKSRVTDSNQEYDIVLAFEGTVFQPNVDVQPNPFNEALLIRYTLPAGEQVGLQVWNSNGQVVLNWEREAFKGINEWALPTQQLQTPGTYFYRLSSKSLQYQGRLVRIP
ncbi:MAG: HYR domain-containing protein, partial [Mameliella sp.]|nr:HYR domain-containing protein [Phaeodactylibacter sp.]